MRETELLHPGGTSKDHGGMVRMLEKELKKVLAIILMGGFIGCINQPIYVEAHGLSQTSYEDGIPNNIREYCEIIGHEYDICPEILEAIAYHESRFLPEVTNKNCYGLMQVNVKVHKERIEKYDWTADDMFDAYKNITVAADYLAELYQTYGDDNPIVLMLYSGSSWKTIEKYKEYGFLTPYVDDILKRSAQYERIHGK